MLNRRKSVNFANNLNLEDKEVIAKEILRIFKETTAHMSGYIKSSYGTTDCEVSFNPSNNFEKFSDEVLSLNLWSIGEKTKFHCRLSSADGVINFCQEVFSSSVYKNGSENLRLSFLDWLERICSKYAGTFYEQIKNYQSNYLHWIVLEPKPTYIKSVESKNVESFKELIFFLTNHASLFNLAPQQLLEKYYAVNKKQFKAPSIHLIISELHIPGIDWSFVLEAKDIFSCKDLPRLVDSTKTKVKVLNFAKIMGNVDFFISNDSFPGYFKTFCHLLFRSRETSHLFSNTNLSWIERVDVSLGGFEHFIVFIFKEDSSSEQQDDLINHVFDFFEIFTILDFKQSKNKNKLSMNQLFLNADETLKKMKSSLEIVAIIDEKIKEQAIHSIEVNCDEFGDTDSFKL